MNISLDGRYALSLFEMDNTLYDEYRRLVSFFTSHHSMFALLSGDLLTLAQKKDIIDSVPFGLTQTMHSFLHVLFENKRFNRFMFIFKIYEEYIHEKKRYHRFHVRYADSINPLQCIQLENIIKKIFDYDELHVCLQRDPTLLAGLCIHTEKHAIDLNLVSHLKDLKKHLQGHYYAN